MNVEKTNDVTFEELQSEFSFELPPTTDVTKAPPTNLEIDLTNTEEEEEVETPEEKPEEEEVVQLTATPFTSVVKGLLEKGEWEDVLIQQEDGTEIKLSELTDVTEEDFYKFVEDQKALKDEDTKDKYIPVEGLDEDKKTIIDIIAKGGDLKTLFQSPQELQKPFDEALGWDLDNESHQMQIVIEDYKSTGISEKRAIELAKLDLEDAELDIKAKAIVEKHQKAYSEHLKKISDTLTQEQEAEKERIKNYRQDLFKVYKENNIPEPLTKKLVDLATKPTKEGILAIDDLYEKAMSDPKQAQEIIFFLADKEKYLEEKTKKKKFESQVEGMRIIKRIPKADKSSPKEEEKEDTTGFRFALPENVKNN